VRVIEARFAVKRMVIVNADGWRPQIPRPVTLRLFKLRDSTEPPPVAGSS
jgi:hypothetical protein